MSHCTNVSTLIHTQRLRPAVSYNALLEICVRTNDLDRGQDIIDRMVSDDVEPDEFSLETVAKKRALRSYLRKTFNI